MQPASTEVHLRAGHRALYFDADSPHRRYHGWKALHDEDDLVVLSKGLGPLRRYLVGFAGLSDERLSKRLLRLRLQPFLSETALHDFADARDAGPPRRVGGRAYRYSGLQDALLLTKTFVLDLSLSLEALRARASKANVRDAHQARAHGIAVRVFQQPPCAELDRFMLWYGEMARERNLPAVSRGLLDAMFAGGNLRMFTAIKEGSPLVDAMVYVARDKAVYLHGVTREKRNDGAGQLLQWEIVDYLKHQGVAWYDLGGVASTDRSDGIYRFKKGFGGDYCCLGEEYVHRTLGFRLILSCKRRLLETRHRMRNVVFLKALDLFR